MVKLENITKRFGTRTVLRRTSLEVRMGERVVLLGENGSGKSTLLQIVVGVLEADSGVVRVSPPLGYAPGEARTCPTTCSYASGLDVMASLKRAR